jgi:ABC-type Fe3+-hydroxamate transport system substrate-binding protein
VTGQRVFAKQPERIAAREGWNAIPAVANGRIHEIKSPLILQPGPAAVTDGLETIIHALHGVRPRDDYGAQCTPPLTFVAIPAGSPR